MPALRDCVNSFDTHRPIEARNPLRQAANVISFATSGSSFGLSSFALSFCSSELNSSQNMSMRGGRMSAGNVDQSPPPWSATSWTRRRISRYAYWNNA